MLLKGKLTKLVGGKWKQGVIWKGQTNLLEIEVGGHKLEHVVLPDDLKGMMQVGDTVEVLVLPFNGYEKTICGIRARGKAKKCGAIYQLAIGIVSGVLFGWLILPLFVAIVSLKSYLEIDAF